MTLFDSNSSFTRLGGVYKMLEDIRKKRVSKHVGPGRQKPASAATRACAANRTGGEN